MTNTTMRTHPTAFCAVVGVDRDGEEERLRAASQRGQSVAAREPCAHVRAPARAQLRLRLRVGDDHPRGDHLTDKVSEALSDAARRGAAKAEHALRRDVDPAVAQEGEEEAAEL
jgi:hypothetical protein